MLPMRFRGSYPVATRVLWVTGNYCALFDDGGLSWQYKLHFEKSELVIEELKRANEILLTRGAGGFGEIYAESEKR
jgi:hypothetical protein